MPRKSSLRRNILHARLARRGPLFLVALGAGVSGGTALAANSQGARPSTLIQALSEAYANNPTLQQSRANLRATDETVPAALSGWRPTVTISASAGRVTGTTQEAFPSGFGTLNRYTLPETRNQATGQITLNQKIFDSGATSSKLHEAKENVFSARAKLISSEQSVFTQVVSDYVKVITDRQLLALDKNNEKVLREQLRSVQDQFNVGEITETGVAQAKASLAGAQSQVEIAQGNLHVAEENFRRDVGAYPAAHLVPPQPLALPVRTKAAAANLAAMNNPDVVSALFDEASSKDAVDAAIAQLGPSVSVSASAYDEDNATGPHTRTTGGQVLANLSMPLYQGGSEYAAVRQARDKEQASYAALDDARRKAVQSATQSWEGLVSSQAAVRSTKEEIKSDAIALDGTEREELVGTRDTLDVLNAQQTLLSAQTNEVQNVANVVTYSYEIAAAIGRLTAEDLDLPVAHYNDKSYYDAVKNAWFGFGNNAYRAAGIAPDGRLLQHGTPQATPVKEEKSR